MTYDAVWTVDHHPALCGTAKFSHQLAERLGVPVSFVSAPHPEGQHPLISVRASEIDWPLLDLKLFGRSYGVFLHDWDMDAALNLRYRQASHQQAACRVVTAARIVYAANRVIAAQVRQSIAREPLTVFAPATIQGNPTRGAFKVLTFGMAHKLKADQYRDLKAMLDQSGRDYTVSVSTAVHEGSPWDATAQIADELRVIFRDRLRVLGYLADDALAKELQECDLVALFYEPALRANNTTYWAAKAAGKPVITNRDKDSPSDDLDVSWDALFQQMGLEVPCANSR